MKFIATTVVLAMAALTSQASAFVLSGHTTLRVAVAKEEPALVGTAFDLLNSDIQRVLDITFDVTDNEPQILVGSLGGPMDAALRATGADLSWLEGAGQAFVITVSPAGQLVVAGSDYFGTAYGLMELSRLIGVSPLEWWADVTPQTLAQLEFPDGYLNCQAPNVSFRGIHVADIEWGLQPWMNRTFDPAALHTLDRKTTRHIFELLLRLRANLFWAPADASSQEFFASPDAQALAAAYGILLGTDEARPLNYPGMEMPVMCVDDGFGYLRHFPTPEEAQLARGCGVYYHASFQGAPHDYLWLGTASPFLMFQQLSEALYHGANRLWVLNVGDIKPCEYQLSLFMDLAWDLEAVRELTMGRHLEEFFAQTVGRDVARLTSIYMKEFYHLAFQCKPEHLADVGTDWTVVRDLPWSEQRIRHRLGRYDLMHRNIEWLADSVRRTHPDHYDAFFELVEYPVQATISQNQKYLLAQLARHGVAWLKKEKVADTWRRSDLAHNRIQELTLQYNNLHDGKWQGIMSSNPAGRQVFQPVPHTQVQAPLPQDRPCIATFYGASYNASSFTGSQVLDPVLGLGASIRAMPVPKDCNITFKYNHNYRAAQTTEVEFHLLPTHPVEQQQRFSVSLDGGEPQTFTYDAEVGSEEWKQNVLRNYAVVVARLPITRAAGEHQLQVSALDDGVVVDEVFVR